MIPRIRSCDVYPTEDGCWYVVTVFAKHPRTRGFGEGRPGPEWWHDEANPSSDNDGVEDTEVCPQRLAPTFTPSPDSLVCSGCRAEPGCHHRDAVRGWAGTTVVYRLYDKRRTLLYVGISKTLMGRMSQHADGKAWWPQVARIDVEHFLSRDAALEAERVAIQSERPLHNVVHNR